MIGQNVFGDAVRATFEYVDGALRWRISPSRSVRAGSIAGAANGRGYTQVQWRGRLFVLHKLIYAYHHGWTPEVVDHIDGDTQNNRIENLRAATKAENQHNAKRRSDNGSGHKNVRKHGDKWQVVIQRNGQRHHIGTFDDLSAAADAAALARQNLHGEFARHA